ncbi:MAG: PulJ/GspJ family protein [Armatimonadota bacterium]
MRSLKNERGVTLLEMMVAVGLLSIVFLGSMSLLSTMLKLWSQGSSGTSSNMYTSVAARRIVRDIQEGRSATIVNGNLVVKFPFQATINSDYSAPNNGNIYTFYLSGPTGVETTGTYLWKKRNSDRLYLIGKNIIKLTVTLPNTKLVMFTIEGNDIIGGVTDQKSTIHTSVVLRNG